MKNNIEIPSIKQLIKSTIIAIALAAVILITLVLPAEYGIDIIGIGEVTGLKKMGEIKTSLADEASREDNKVTNREKDTTVYDAQKEATVRKNEITFTLAPNEGKEYKLVMKKGAKVKFHWKSNGGRINFDTHGDSKKLKIRYHKYTKGSLRVSEGSLVAAFDGKHGWFWRNRSGKKVTITLNVEGAYSIIVQVK